MPIVVVTQDAAPLAKEACRVTCRVNRYRIVVVRKIVVMVSSRVTCIVVMVSSRVIVQMVKSRVTERAVTCRVSCRRSAKRAEHGGQGSVLVQGKQGGLS